MTPPTRVGFIALWLGYFLVLLFACMPQGLDTELSPSFGCVSDAGQPVTPCPREVMHPLGTNADIIRVFKTADPAFMAKTVWTIGEARDWGHISAWPLWPPGMVALQAFCYWLSPKTPVALVLIALSSAAWAAVFTQIAGIARRSAWGGTASFILPLLLLPCAEFAYLLRVGLFYTESLSIAFFLLGIGCVFQAAPRRNLRRAFWGGAFFALSAYMRAQTDIVMTLSLLLLSACAIGSSFSAFRVLSLRTVKQVFASSALLAVLGVALLTYQGLTFPYRAMHHMQWVAFTENPLWHAVWEREEDLPPMLQFYIDGGGAAGCKLDPELCDQIHAHRAKEGDNYTLNDYFHFTLQSFLHHPVKWFTFKASRLLRFWLDGTAESVLLTCLLPLLLFYGIGRHDNGWEAVVFLLLTTLAGIAGPLMLTHIEPRYLYQLKLLLLYAAFILIANTSRPRQAREEGEA